MADKLLKGGAFLVESSTADSVFTPEDFSDEQKSIAETTEQFVENEIVPNIDEIDAQNFDIVVEKLKMAGELGLLMVDAPEAYGGLELDTATSMLVAEKIAPAGSFSVAFSAHVGIGTLPIVYYGTDDQKKRYVEKIITGEWIAAYCLTEPESGSDALGARTSAVLSEDGKHYILNGTKQFITNGGFADVFTVFAKIDKKDFTAFIVERSWDGVSIGPEEKKLGIKGSSTTQVMFDNVKVPVENLLGEAGKGHKIAFNILNIGRFKLGAAVTGAAKHAMGVGAKYAVERKQFTVPIATFGAIREKFADMAASIFAAESLVYRLAGMIDGAVHAIDKNDPDYYTKAQNAIEEYSVECTISKVFCSDVLAKTVDEVVQVHGGYGYIAEYPAERFYRDERINRIFEGTNEINRMLIPGMILRKAMKGELPLQQKAMAAIESLMTPSFDTPDDDVLYAKEKQTVDNLKTMFLTVAGAAVQKYGESLKDEQEILIAAADVVINIFAAESAILRAEKIRGSLSDRKKELLDDTIASITMMTSDAAGLAGKKAAYYAEEGDTLTMLLSGIRRFSKYDATNILKGRRRLADAVTESGAYLF